MIYSGAISGGGGGGGAGCLNWRRRQGLDFFKKPGKKYLIYGVFVIYIYSYIVGLSISSSLLSTYFFFFWESGKI